MNGKEYIKKVVMSCKTGEQLNTASKFLHSNKNIKTGMTRTLKYFYIDELVKQQHQYITKLNE